MGERPGFALLVIYFYRLRRENIKKEISIGYRFYCFSYFLLGQALINPTYLENLRLRLCLQPRRVLQNPRNHSIRLFPHYLPLTL